MAVDPSRLPDLFLAAMENDTDVMTRELLKLKRVSGERIGEDTGEEDDEDDFEGQWFLPQAVSDVNMPWSCDRLHHETVLCWAARFGHAPIARLLLSHGADINFVSEDGVSALCRAARHCHYDFAKILLAGGAEVRPLALVWAAAGPSESAVNLDRARVTFLLLGAGAAVNTAVRDPLDGCVGIQRTPLEAAIRNHKHDVILILFLHGAQFPPGEVSSLFSSLDESQRNAKTERVLRDWPDLLGRLTLLLLARRADRSYECLEDETDALGALARFPGDVVRMMAFGFQLSEPTRAAIRVVGEAYRMGVT